MAKNQIKNQQKPVNHGEINLEEDEYGFYDDEGDNEEQEEEEEDVDDQAPQQQQPQPSTKKAATAHLQDKQSKLPVVQSQTKQNKDRSDPNISKQSAK
jgi:hypothetical protein